MTAACRLRRNQNSFSLSSRSTIMRTRSSKPTAKIIDPDASIAPTASPILTLPNELLRNAFCFLPNPLHTSQHWPKFTSLTRSQRLILQPILVVRQVCRHFRAVANHLPLWYDDAFELGSLISNFEGGGRLRLSEFVRSLLSDEQLRKCLARKTYWTFHSHSIFSIIFSTIPAVHETVTGLAFVPGNTSQEFIRTGCRGDAWFDKLIGVVEHCPQLQSLTLEYAGDLDLDKISKVRPALGVLHVSFLRYSSLSGSLDRFSDLNELVCKNVSRSYKLSPIDLPIALAKSLRILEIRGGAHQFSFTSLALLSNLSTLFISPCNQPLFTAIIEATFSLTRFGVGISAYDSIPIDEIVELISSPSLKNVEIFSFHLENYESSDSVADEWTETVYGDFMAAIYSNFHSLHTIDLSMPFRSTCFYHFARLVNIESVSWEGRLIDREGTDSDDAVSSAELAKAAVDDAFVAFERKPKCNVNVHPKKIYRRVTMARCLNSHPPNPDNLGDDTASELSTDISTDTTEQFHGDHL